MLTLTPLNELDSGMDPACERDPANSVPNIEISEPGATLPALSLLAAFNTPPAATTGVCEKPATALPNTKIANSVKERKNARIV
jgi:hypothetical protein